MNIKGLGLTLLFAALSACGDVQDPAAEQQAAAPPQATATAQPEAPAAAAGEAGVTAAPPALPASETATEPATDSAAGEAAEESENIVLAQAESAPAAPRPAPRFQQGKHYQRLTPTQPTSSSPEQVEVAEVFWYGCSHCYNFDPYVERWLTRKPDEVNFVRIPAVWNPLVKFHARAFYAAQALDKESVMHTAFFREIHLNGNALDTEAKLIDFFGNFGVSADDFSAAFNSFAVHTKLQQAETLARRYRVTSVPLVVVNGKYTTSATMTGGYDTLMEVIDELVLLEGDAG